MNFNFPTFTEFYKFHLVDELALCNNPALIHYGKCSLIGYLSRSDAIESLTIPNINKSYQLPDCALSVRLSMDFHPALYLNNTVEIFGEVKLFDPAQPDVELSAHSLIQRLRDLQTSLEQARGLPGNNPSGTNDKSLHFTIKSRLQKEIEQQQKTFKPLIKVHTIRHIAEAREIIAENLHYRQIQKVRNRLHTSN